MLQPSFLIYFTKPKSLGKIASEKGVAKASAFNFIDGKRTDDPDFIAMRFLVNVLHKNGISLVQYKHAIRIRMLLDEYGIEPEAGEAIIKKLLVAIYTEKWNPEDLISTLKQFKESAGVWSMISLEYATDQIRCKEMYNNYHVQLAQEKKDYAELVNKHKVVRDNMDILTKFGGASRIFTDALKYKPKYLQLLKDTDNAQNGKPIDSTKLKKLNKLLTRTVTEEDILDKINDIKQNPEEYWHLFDN